MTASAIGTALTVASYTGIVVGQVVTGFGIADGTYVTIVSTNTITINQNTTAIIAAGTPVQFAFTIKLPRVVFRTGVIDGNNVAEITLLERVAA
jgi:phage protein U